MDKGFSYRRVSPLLGTSKFIFYLTPELLKACKLLLLYSTCLSGSASHLDRQVCVWIRVRTYASAHLRTCSWPKENRGARAVAMSPYRMLIQPYRGSIRPSIHPCNKTHYIGDCLRWAIFLPARKAHHCMQLWARGSVPHHNETRTCMDKVLARAVIQ